MKIAMLFAPLLFCLAWSPVRASSLEVAGLVLEDDKELVRFSLAFPADQSIGLDIGDALRLAITGPSAEAPITIIRLLSGDGKVLHTAQTEGSNPEKISLAYRICKGEVTYMGPAPTVVPSCDK